MRRSLHGQGWTVVTRPPSRPKARLSLMAEWGSGPTEQGRVPFIEAEGDTYAFV